MTFLITAVIFLWSGRDNAPVKAAFSQAQAMLNFIPHTLPRLLIRAYYHVNHSTACGIIICTFFHIENYDMRNVGYGNALLFDISLLGSRLHIALLGYKNIKQPVRKVSVKP